MWGPATLDRDVLSLALSECAVELANDRYDHKLSLGMPAVSVASFYEEPILRRSNSRRAPTASFQKLQLVE